jgi:hypothetical protein
LAVVVDNFILIMAPTGWPLISPAEAQFQSRNRRLENISCVGF